MQRMLSATILLAAIAAAYSSGAAAQQGSQDDALHSQSRDSGLATSPYITIKTAVRIEQIPARFGAEDAERLIGMSAVSRQGEKVGEIVGVVRSPDGRLLAVVDAGEFLDVRVRPVALPIEPGRIDSNGNLRVQASRKELESLPVFATNLINTLEATDGSDEAPRLAADLQRQRSEREAL